MERATISQLKNHLSAYLDKVKNGHTILILDRDQPVARLERAGALDDPLDRVAALERSGILKRSSRPLAGELLHPAGMKPIRTVRSGSVSGKSARKNASVLQALLDERDSGR